jgi:sugar lactone lactonase YvrE
MKNILLAALVFSVVIIACQSPKENIAEATIENDPVKTAPVTLALKWETDSVLTTCESVLYDKERDVIYVSNINGQPDQKDKNGFISTLNLDGKVQEREWITGLNAPKGLALSGDKLYVADIDRVHEIDIKKKKISTTYAIDGAVFLNDITVDSEGRVFISDTEAGKVMMIENGKLSTWLENVDGPNGLLAEDGRMIMLTWGGKTVNTIDPASKQITVQADSIENLDGVEAVGNGDYLLSSWNGMIHYVDNNWKNYIVADFRADSVQSADIDYIQEKKLLLVPTFFTNTVRAYEVTVNE